MHCDISRWWLRLQSDAAPPSVMQVQMGRKSKPRKVYDQYGWYASFTSAAAQQAVDDRQKAAHKIAQLKAELSAKQNVISTKEAEFRALEQLSSERSCGPGSTEQATSVSLAALPC